MFFFERLRQQPSIFGSGVLFEDPDFFLAWNAWKKQQRQQPPPHLWTQRNNLFFCELLEKLVKFWWVFFFFDLVLVVVFKTRGIFKNRPFTTVQQKFHKDTAPVEPMGPRQGYVLPNGKTLENDLHGCPVGFAPRIGPKKSSYSYLKCAIFFSNKICREGVSFFV